MNKKLSILVLAISILGLLALFAANRITVASEQKNASDSVEDLKARVSKLEMEIAALQGQVKELASKASSKVLTLPGTQVFPGNKVPPGAKEHEINGMKYWTIPIKDGK
jgi:hypothetical protein